MHTPARLELLAAARQQALLEEAAHQRVLRAISATQPRRDWFAPLRAIDTAVRSGVTAGWRAIQQQSVCVGVESTERCCTG